MIIIGVLAALTIPNLIQSYKKHQVEVGVKESYSILSNAIKMSEAENGNPIEWNYFQSGDNFAKQYIFPYLKINKICGSRDKSTNDCFAKENGMHNFRTLRDELTLYVGQRYITGIMANGMSIGVFASEGCWAEPSAMFAIDIDGPTKGKSVIGKDVFFFTLTAYRANKAILLPGMDNYNVGYASLSIEQLLSSDTGGGCNMSDTGSAERYHGGQCALVIMKNGWKIPDNYPVKKW